MNPIRQATLLFCIALRVGSQSINIDWSSGSPRLSDCETTGRPLQKDWSEAEASEDAYEEAWWRNGHGEDDRTTWFAASPEPRTVRPSNVVHRIGDVYTHENTGARGVIIGWDRATRAPRQWVDSVDHFNGERRSWADRMFRLTQPFYSVLEVAPDGHTMQRYVIARCRPVDDPDHDVTCLRVETAPWGHVVPKLDHPDVAKYFSHRTEHGYEPRAELAARYPRDVEERVQIPDDHPGDEF